MQHFGEGVKMLEDDSLNIQGHGSMGERIWNLLEGWKSENHKIIKKCNTRKTGTHLVLSASFLYSHFWVRDFALT